MNPRDARNPSVYSVWRIRSIGEPDRARDLDREEKVTEAKAS